jgi:malate dehydrogenase (oxaloacetate-decarboxylating)
MPSVSYSITIRLEFAARSAAVSDITGRIEQHGATVTALDVSASGPERMRADITVLTSGHDHAMEVVDSLKDLAGVELGKVSDRTFLAHLGGKLTVESKLPIRHRDDLSMIYTPGVARVVKAIAENPEDARRLTIKRNTVAVVSDGSAILGLGDLGPLAAMPVMEGKAALFKRFADIDAFPICLDAHTVDEIVAHVKAIAPVFAGINLEDISAPRCFEIEDRLRAELDIPVFHDDQHGTAIVVVAALRNALRVVEKDISTARIVLSGAGAAGTAILRLLRAAGARDIIVTDIDGIVHEDREQLEGRLPWIAEVTNPRQLTGTLQDAVAGADVFIGVSAGNILTADDVATMAERSIVVGLGDRPGRGGQARRGRRDRAQRLRQPDQQRPRLPRRVPRPAGRPRHPGQRPDAARRGEGPGRRRLRRGAQPHLHRPERLPRRGDQGGRERGRAGRPRGGRDGRHDHRHDDRGLRRRDHAERLIPLSARRRPCRAVGASADGAAAGDLTGWPT